MNALEHPLSESLPAPIPYLANLKVARRSLLPYPRVRTSIQKTFPIPSQAADNYTSISSRLEHDWSNHTETREQRRETWSQSPAVREPAINWVNSNLRYIQMTRL